MVGAVGVGSSKRDGLGQQWYVCHGGLVADMYTMHGVWKGGKPQVKLVDGK